MEKMTDKISWANFRRVFANCNVLTLTVGSESGHLGRLRSVPSSACGLNSERFARLKETIQKRPARAHPELSEQSDCNLHERRHMKGME
jgi:hypothetical protein